MPYKKRHGLIDLGAIAEASSSDEFDLSASTNAILHMTRSTSAEVYVHFESSPVPFGTAVSDWHKMYQVFQVPNTEPIAAYAQSFQWQAAWDDALCIFMPCRQNSAWVGSTPNMLDTRTPRRMRISITGSGVSLTEAYIETIRSIS